MEKGVFQFLSYALRWSINVPWWWQSRSDYFSFGYQPDNIFSSGLLKRGWYQRSIIYLKSKERSQSAFRVTRPCFALYVWLIRSCENGVHTRIKYDSRFLRSAGIAPRKQVPYVLESHIFLHLVFCTMCMLPDAAAQRLIIQAGVRIHWVQTKTFQKHTPVCGVVYNNFCPINCHISQYKIRRVEYENEVPMRRPEGTQYPY